ncbi:hypothetical protein H0H93_010703 [Arthromyces matolae]|nr:hypothetical protein H0H93_010703 [Arthromyces matolae]
MTHITYHLLDPHFSGGVTSQGIIFCMIVARGHRSVNTSSQQLLTTANSRTRNFSHALRSPIPISVRITTQIDNKFDPKGFGTPPASPGVYSLRSVTTTGEVRQIETV